MIEKLTNQILSGGFISQEEALQLANHKDKKAFYAGAMRITKHFMQDKFDTCSILNARSGLCSEDCKWCSQSAHYHTSATNYPLLSLKECLEQAIAYDTQGVNRFSLVTSGRKVSNNTLLKIVEIVKAIKKATTIKCCASLGLLDKEALKQLKESGVENYHCNIETAPSYFNKLCTTHTQTEKWETLNAARAVGMRICCGGIIGMGETMEQRIEMAFHLQQHHVLSIPINLLQPIPGTPLAASAPLTEEEYLTTVALFRYLNPQAYLRFSGGRSLLSKETQRIALQIGVNAAIVGDLLTTVGSSVQQDKELFTALGYNLSSNTDWNA
jgi:biotin synthase